MCWCTIWNNWLFSGNGSRVLSSFLITTSTNTYNITLHQNNNALSTKYGTWLHRIMVQPRFICTSSIMYSRDITPLRVCNKGEKIWSAVRYTFWSTNIIIVHNDPIYQTTLLQCIFIAQSYKDLRPVFIYNEEKSFDAITLFTSLSNIKTSLKYCI